MLETCFALVINEKQIQLLIKQIKQLIQIVEKLVESIFSQVFFIYLFSYFTKMILIIIATKTIGQLGKNLFLSLFFN